MANVFVERRQLSDGVALTWDMAHHLYMRQNNWPVVVLADNPQVLLPALRKQWLKVVGKLRKEYSSTLSQARKRRLLSVIGHMEALRFTVRSEVPLGEAVYILTPAEAQVTAVRLGAIRGSQTIYATCPVNAGLESSLMDCLKHHGLLVEYDFVGD
ncbi:MAG TPA: hypothetical protein VLF71_00510 [Candidatus Saccharimonadales bacterium]|nr:hypothetical protein [Candidatus Saccharimonadales bacterium]